MQAIGSSSISAPSSQRDRRRYRSAADRTDLGCSPPRAPRAKTGEQLACPGPVPEDRRDRPHGHRHDSAQDAGDEILRGSIWMALGFGSRHRRLLSMLVLARLLEPSAFGLVAISFAIISTIEYLRGAGVWSAIVHRRTEVEEAAASAGVYWVISEPRDLRRVFRARAGLRVALPCRVTRRGAACARRRHRPRSAERRAVRDSRAGPRLCARRDGRSPSRGRAGRNHDRSCNRRRRGLEPSLPARSSCTRSSVQPSGTLFRGGRHCGKRAGECCESFPSTRALPASGTSPSSCPEQPTRSSSAASSAPAPPASTTSRSASRPAPTRCSTT